MYDFLNFGSHTGLHHFRELGWGWRPERRRFLKSAHSSREWVRERTWMKPNGGTISYHQLCSLTHTYRSSILEDARETMG